MGLVKPIESVLFVVTKLQLDVPNRFNRNPVAIYKENFTVKGKKKEAQLTFYMECYLLLN